MPNTKRKGRTGGTGILYRMPMFEDGSRVMPGHPVYDLIADLYTPSEWNALGPETQDAHFNHYWEVAFNPAPPVDTRPTGPSMIDLWLGQMQQAIDDPMRLPPTEAIPVVRKKDYEISPAQSMTNLVEHHIGQTPLKGLFGSDPGNPRSPAFTAPYLPPRRRG